jgi:stage V sporulation protein S
MVVDQQYPGPKTGDPQAWGRLDALLAIGAGAINQAVKAIAIARGFVAPSGMDLICIPAFTDIMIDGEERTAIKLIIEPR